MSNPTFTLEAGAYRIEAKQGGKPIHADTTLRPGERLDMTLAQPKRVA